MKITNIHTYPVMAKLERLEQVPVSVPRPGRTGDVIFAGYRALLVRIETDAGVYGSGEGLVRLAPKATAAIVRDLEPLLIGRDPRRVESLWDDMFATMANRGHNRGFMLEAISAIDIALWDIVGKAAGAPLSVLLGGPSDAVVPCYASSLRIKGVDEVVEDARGLVRDGYRAIKLKVGRGAGRLGEDIESVEAVQAAVGSDVQLMVDANCGFSLPDAVRMARRLEDLGVTWFEEPLKTDDLRDYAALRRKVDIPIAAGETWFTRYDFRDALVQEAVDIVQPDVSRCGGITEARRIAWLAETFHRDYAPHTGQSSAVCLTASLHLAAALPNATIYEYVSTDWSSSTPNPLRTAIARPSLDELRQGGDVRLPSGPGLGIDLDWARLDELVVR